MSENYFEKFINDETKGVANSETFRAIKSLKKVGFLFDRNDWDAILLKAVKNPVIAFAVIKQDSVPERIREQLLDIYLTKTEYAHHFLIALAYRTNISKQECKNHTKELVSNKKSKSKLMFDDYSSDIYRYGERGMKDVPLNIDIANQLVTLQLDDEIQDINGVQFRYADFSHFLPSNTKDEKILELARDDIIGENAKTELANNHHFTEKFRNQIFEFGCDYDLLRDITPYMAQEIYRSCMETLSKFSDESNRDLTKYARDTLCKVFKSKKLPVSCEFDFVSRWRELEKNGVDKGLLFILLENCKEAHTITWCCNVNNTSHNIAHYVLTDKEIHGIIPIHIKENTFLDILNEWHKKHHIVPNDRANIATRKIKEMLKTCSIPDEALEILLSYNTSQFTSTMTKSHFTSEKTLRQLCDRFDDDTALIFAAKTNIEMQKQKLDKYISVTISVIEGLLQNHKHLNDPEMVKKNFAHMQIHFDQREDLDKILNILKNNAVECNFKSMTEVILPAFELLQETKYKSDQPYEYFGELFKYQYNDFVIDIDKLDKINQQEFKKGLLQLPKDDLFKIKEQLEEEVIDGYGWRNMENISEILEFINNVLPIENTYNTIVETILEKQKTQEKEEKWVDEEVEF